MNPRWGWLTLLVGAVITVSGAGGVAAAEGAAAVEGSPPTAPPTVTVATPSVAAPSFATRTVVAGDTTLSVVTAGPDDAGLCIILVNGGPGLSHEYLRSLAAMLLTPGRQVVLYDQRGCGASPMGKAPDDLDRNVADLDAVRAAFAHRPTILIGHSWGALIVGADAGRHADDGDLRAVVLIDPMAPTYADLETARLSMRQRKADLAQQGVLKHRSELPEWAGASDDDREALLILPAYFHDPHHPAADTLGGSHGSAEVRHAIIDSLGKSYDQRPDLARIAVPTLVVHGASDPFGPGVATATHAALAATTRAPLAIIAAAGHLPWIEQPAAFGAVVEPFVVTASAR